MEIVVITILILVVMVLVIKFMNKKPKIVEKKQDLLEIEALNNYDGIIKEMKKEEELENIEKTEEKENNEQYTNHNQNHDEQKAPSPPVSNDKKEIFNTEEAIIHNAILKRKDRS